MNTNDGTQNPPRLRLDLNLGTLTDLPPFSKAPRGSKPEVLAAIKAAGYEGVQSGKPDEVRAAGLRRTTSARINQVGEAEPFARRSKDEGADCGTLHVAWGIEDDAEVDALVDDVLNAQAKHRFPLYIETHRATITQDIWRTVQLTRRHPDVRFNGDFSHWYTGLEMVYGDFDAKLDFAQPVFDRVRFIHGRIGNSGSMQVDIGDGTGRKHVDHFRAMWTRCFAGFLKTARPGDFICFTPELLQPSINYARVFPGASGELVEEGDRWEQAQLYCQIARECFEAARRG